VLFGPGLYVFDEGLAVGGALDLVKEVPEVVEVESHAFLSQFVVNLDYVLLNRHQGVDVLP
jgi:hypothetical protein